MPSVHKGCGNGSMIVFTPDGKGKNGNDTKCIEQVKQIMASTPGFDIVYDRGAYVLDVDVNGGVYVNDEGENSRATPESVFPVIRKEYWERALNQAQQDHERKESIQQDVHGENQNTFEHVKVKVTPKPYEPTKEERQSHEATQCPFRAWCEICVKAKSLDGKYAKQVGNPEHIPVTEFDYAFATDMPGGPKMSMMVATDSIQGWIFAGVARRKGGQDDYVMQSFQNYIDRLGLVKAELKCDQEPSTLDVANALIRRCQSTALIVIATPKRLERDLWAWRTSEFVNSGTASGISRSRLNEKQDRSWTGSRVDGLDGTTLCMGCKQFPSEGNRENALSFSPGQRLHWISCAIWRSVLGAKPL